ncbi:MAG: hypothetical protein GY879_14075, partial [Planctomycetes bacterium]|nr:hypothetical protein [Planctomycetota bacterium]
LLAKELLLTKLHREEELPKLNQQFYSALYTSMRNGKWTHGHDELNIRRRVANPGFGSVMSQAMALVGKKLASETETHLRQHYEKFCRKWYKWTEQDDDEGEEHDIENFLDPDTADLVRGACVGIWKRCPTHPRALCCSLRPPPAAPPTSPWTQRAWRACTGFYARTASAKKESDRGKRAL